MEKQVAVIIGLAISVAVVSFLYWLIKRPTKMTAGTILESSIEFTRGLEVVTILTIKNLDGTITHAYMGRSHRNLKGKQIEYCISKLSWLDSKVEYYTEESADAFGNKIIEEKIRTYIAIIRATIKGGIPT